MSRQKDSTALRTTDTVCDTAHVTKDSAMCTAEAASSAITADVPS